MGSTDWAGSATIDQLREQNPLVYRAFTVVQAEGGVDGSLQSPDGKVIYPLDLYTPEERHNEADTTAARKSWADGKVHTIVDNHGIVVPTEDMGRDTVVVAVSRWCLQHLAHDNITFEISEDG